MSIFSYFSKEARETRQEQAELRKQEAIEKEEIQERVNYSLDLVRSNNLYVNDFTTNCCEYCFDGVFTVSKSYVVVTPANENIKHKKSVGQVCPRCMIGWKGHYLVSEELPLIKAIEEMLKE